VLARPFNETRHILLLIWLLLFVVVNEPTRALPYVSTLGGKTVGGFSHTMGTNSLLASILYKSVPISVRQFYLI
jgi:hypothetical protein